MAPNFLTKFGKSGHSKGQSDADSLRGRTPSPDPRSRSRKISTAASEFPKLLLTNDNDETMAMPSPFMVNHQRADSVASGNPSMEEYHRLSSADRRAMSLSTGSPPVSAPRTLLAKKSLQGSDLSENINDVHNGTIASPPQTKDESGATLPHRARSMSRNPTAKEEDVASSNGDFSVPNQSEPPSEVATTPSTPPNTQHTSSQNTRRDSTASAISTASNENDDGSVYQSTSPLSESPTRMRHDIDLPRSRQSSLMPPADVDAVSIHSASTSPDISGTKKKSWRRTSSPKNKPMGLAGAIAASGLAMANTGMTQRIPSSMSTASFPIPLSSSQGPEQTLPPQQGKELERMVSNISLSRPPSRQPSEAGESHYEDDALTGSEEESDNDLDLDLNEDDIPVTGFAVASYKRNLDFHELFPAVPDGDYLIEDYGCALQREILIQGRIYISENHICFHANIFGWITDLVVPIYEISQLEKKMTAFVIPNAIQITTRTAKYTFASFMSRDTTFDVIHNIWRLARPDDSVSLGSGLSPRASIDEKGSLDGVPVPGARRAAALAGQRKATQCACSRDGKHLSEVAMDTVLPGSPEKIYNLIFASGFIKEFMRVDQKLMEIQVSDWQPTTVGDTKLLARNMSYIKPLTGSLGPKQTKCELRDETIYCDFDDYVVTCTTTRTPDVPSGGVFSVKTRTCLMWANSASTRVVVTTQVEWTGRSFIKGIIEKSCIDGQKAYHGDLDRAIRAYISEHRAEFLEGLDIAAVDAVETAQLVESPMSPTGGPSIQDTLSSEAARKAREKERNARGLQWALDTVEGTYKVAKQSTHGALELIRDAWDHSSSSTILIFLVVILVFSNLWTLTRVSRREEVGRRKERQNNVEREQWVQGIVTALWEELAASRDALPVPSIPNVNADLLEQAEQISKILDAIEERVHLLRNDLKALTDFNESDPSLTGEL